VQGTAGFRARLSAVDQSLTAALTLPARLRGAQLAALALAHSGDSPVWGALVVAAWFLGDHDWKVRALVCAIGLVVVEVAVILLKMVFRRRRPAGELGRIYRRADPYSFPSGHAARAALLCILAAQLGPVAALAAIAIWSPIMVLSRIAVGIHYVFDVVAGVILGCGLTAALLLVVPTVAARV
jgi:membrane-associated phospholipid phosphatase